MVAGRLWRWTGRGFGLLIILLGSKLDVPHSWVQRIEMKERRLDVLEFVKYCEALGIDEQEALKKITGK